MVEPPAQTFFDALVPLLGHPSIVECESRRSLRRQTGSLLEEAFLALAVALEPDLSVEIGAHEANFSARLKQRLPRVRTLAFEANPYVFDRYARSPDNRLSAVDYRNAAICDTLGTVDLFIPTRWSKGTFGKANAISSLHTRNSPQFDYETVSVPSLTLDAAVEGIAFTSAVAWIDVEGAQRQVIEAAPRFLAGASAIFIEVETEQIWSNQSMAGQVTELLTRHGFVPLMRDNLAKVQHNCVYVRDGGRPAELSRPIAAKYIEDIKNLVAD